MFGGRGGGASAMIIKRDRERAGDAVLGRARSTERGYVSLADPKGETDLRVYRANRRIAPIIADMKTASHGDGRAETSCNKAKYGRACVSRGFGSRTGRPQDANHAITAFSHRTCARTEARASESICLEGEARAGQMSGGGQCSVRSVFSFLSHHAINAHAGLGICAWGRAEANH
jgi:hypothetical protein